MPKKKQKRAFWDTAAGFNNPSSIHREGVEASKVVEEARAKIAKILFAHPDEIIFTGSGTESDNLAILGTAELATKKHIITTSIEHKAVMAPCEHLRKRGYRVTYLPVFKDGVVSLKALKEALSEDTFLVSIIYANNEIGTIQPIKEIAKIIRHFKKEKKSSYPYLHIDACQAPRFLNLNVEQLGVDLMTFNGSKIYGPQGIGCLFVRRGVHIAPVLLGGGQERGLRSGTHNVTGIVGLAKALEICDKNKDKETIKLTKVRDYLMIELKKIEGVKINGGEMNRLPNNINFSIENFEGEQLVLELDAKGFAVSSGSACAYNNDEGSYVILAIGGTEAEANSAVRISLPREVEIVDAKNFIKALKEIITKYQGLPVK